MNTMRHSAMMIFVPVAALLLLAPPSAANDQRRRKLPHMVTFDGLKRTIQDTHWAEKNLERCIAKARRRPDACQEEVAVLKTRVRDDHRAAVNANLAILAEPLFNVTLPQSGGDDSGAVALASTTTIGKWEKCGCCSGWVATDLATTSELENCKNTEGCEVSMRMGGHEVNRHGQDCGVAFIECVCEDEEEGPEIEDDEPAETQTPLG